MLYSIRYLNKYDSYTSLCLRSSKEVNMKNIKSIVSKIRGYSDIKRCPVGAIQFHEIKEGDLS